MPSHEPFEDDGGYKARRVLYDMLDELCALSKQLKFSFFEYGVHKPTIVLLESSNLNEGQLKQWFRPQVLEQCEVMRFSVGVPFPDEARFDVPVDIPSAEKEEYVKAVHRLLIEQAFCKRVSDLLVMANISRIGSMELKDSVVIQEGNLRKYSHLPQMDAWSLQRAVELTESMGWPKLQTLDFAQVWRWFAEHEGLLDSFSNSAIGRALNAFSRLFEIGTRDEPMQLLWALVGIEALYVKGKVALIEQVKGKAQAFLGPQEAYKKKIGKMYEFRSRFVHGDLDFPGLYLLGDAREAVEKFDRDLLESIALAVAVLVATLQELIRRDWTGLDYSYKVSDWDHVA
jgi:hypothetical protein